MTTSNIISNEYFNWLYNLACSDRYDEPISYKKLLAQLHNTVFRYSIQRDENRAEYGINLRRLFAYDYTDIKCADKYLTGPCSVLEMMLALSIQCEEIMDDTAYGDRTRQWFWGMVTNLGLGDMADNHYDKKYVSHVLERFLDRDYEADGRGGLFRIKNCADDLRDIEIWVQMLWYLDSVA